MLNYSLPCSCSLNLSSFWLILRQQWTIKISSPFFLFLAWRPSWLEFGITGHKFGRGQFNDHFTKVWLQLAQWFLRRRLKCEMLMDGRRTKSDGNSSQRPGELKSVISSVPGFYLREILLNVNIFNPYYNPFIGNACCFSLPISLNSYRSFNTYRITAVWNVEKELRYQW